MLLELIEYWPQIASMMVIAAFMAVSPGSDFVLVTRNSLFHSRTAGLYSALGVSLAIWIHVAYSIAGLAVIIANSVVLFSIIKYLGAAYLFYVGWQSLRAKKQVDDMGRITQSELPRFSAFKMGFISNALNPKTTLFFLSIFTQVVEPNTPLLVQLIYGAIISMAHLVWFSVVSLSLSHPQILRRFNGCKHWIERCVGGVLIAFGLKVATASQA